MMFKWNDQLNWQAQLSRRDALQIGAISSLGLSLPTLLHAQATASNQNKSTAKAKSCILIWLDGGPSHLETFDLKPHAPQEVRGPFSAIQTSVSGVQICEQLPRTAKLLHDAAMIRSMTSPLGEHNLGAHYLLTGYQPSPALTYPSLGGVVSYLQQQQKQQAVSTLPAHIAIPKHNPADAQGYLPKQFAPFALGSDPSKPNFQVRDLNFYPKVSLDRIHRRKKFVNALDQFQSKVEEKTAQGKTPQEIAKPHQQNDLQSDPQLEQAYRLITSKTAKAAFDLDQEPNPIRQKYGRKKLGQSCLLARRLVERDVPFVTVFDQGWDTHEDLVLRLQEGYTGAKVGVGLIPTLDLALSALLEDLVQRNLLDETLVVVMGEFGRTPKLNTRKGRDHWPRVFSVLLAGGGIQGGRVIGASDSVGESPKETPVTPNDLAATIYTLLGIDPHQMLYTQDGRPVAINQGGEVIQALL